MFKNKYGKVRSGWKIAAMMASSFLAIIIIGAIVGIIGGIFFAKQIISDGGASLQSLKLPEDINKIIELISMFIQEIVLIATPIIAWKFIQKRNLSSMGLTPVKHDTKDLLVGLIFGMLSISLVFLALVMTGNAQVESWRPHFSPDQITYLFLYIFVGFAEEIFTRGYIMSSLKQTRSIAAAVIISSIIFAVMHSGNTGIGILPYINLALIGVLFAYMYLKSGNIWMCIGFHITWNYFQGFVYGFKVSGNDTNGMITTTFKSYNILNGKAFGPEGGLFVTVVILIGLLFINYYYRNREFDFLSSETEIQNNMN